MIGRTWRGLFAASLSIANLGTVAGCGTATGDVVASSTLGESDPGASGAQSSDASAVDEAAAVQPPQANECSPEQAAATLHAIDLAAVARAQIETLDYLEHIIAPPTETRVAGGEGPEGTPASSPTMGSLLSAAKSIAQQNLKEALALEQALVSTCGTPSPMATPGAGPANAGTPPGASGATPPGTTPPGTTSPGTTSPGAPTPGTARPGPTTPGATGRGRTGTGATPTSGGACAPGETAACGG